MAPNIELLEADIAYLEAHPEEHQQGIYINECGTAYCLAGYRALQEAPKLGLRFTGYAEFSGRRDVHAFTIAMEAYGLDEDQAHWLFRGKNTIDDLKSIVKNIANGEEAPDFAIEAEGGTL